MASGCPWSNENYFHISNSNSNSNSTTTTFTTPNPNSSSSSSSNPNPKSNYNSSSSFQSWNFSSLDNRNNDNVDDGFTLAPINYEDNSLIINNSNSNELQQLPSIDSPSLFLPGTPISNSRQDQQIPSPLFLHQGMRSSNRTPQQQHQQLHQSYRTSHSPIPSPDYFHLNFAEQDNQDQPLPPPPSRRPSREQNLPQQFQFREGEQVNQESRDEEILQTQLRRYQEEFNRQRGQIRRREERAQRARRQREEEQSQEEEERNQRREEQRRQREEYCKQRRDRQQREEERSQEEEERSQRREEQRRQRGEERRQQREEERRKREEERQTEVEEAIAQNQRRIPRSSNFIIEEDLAAFDWDSYLSQPDDPNHPFVSRTSSRASGISQASTFIDLTENSSEMPPSRKRKAGLTLPSCRPSKSSKSLSRKPNPTATINSDDVEVVDLAENDNLQEYEAAKAKRQEDLIKQQNHQEATKSVKLVEFQCIICMDNVTDLTITHCGMFSFDLRMFF